MEQGYKFRIYPTAAQEILIAKTLGCCRYVWNHYLDLRKELYAKEKKTFNYNACSKDLTALKKNLEWLKEVDSTALQSSLKDLETAYKNFFRRIRNHEPKAGYENPDMELKTVFRSDAVLAVGKNHRFAKRKSISFAELDSEPMVLVSKEYMFYDQILQRCAEAGFVPQVTFTSSQWDLLLEMVAENKGVTIICRPLVEKLYSGRVVCVPLKKPEFPWTLGLIAKKNRSLPRAAKSLWDFCAKV